MNRERLPARRQSETIAFNFQGRLNYLATIGFYDDGRIGEVFLEGRKRSTEMDVMARDLAIVLSFAFQNGATVDDIRAAITRDAQGNPEGVAGVLLDLIAEVMA